MTLINAESPAQVQIFSQPVPSICFLCPRLTLRFGLMDNRK